MALDRTASRASLTYLRRRPKAPPVEKISMERPGRSHSAPAKPAPTSGTPLSPPSGGTPLSPPRPAPSGGTPLSPPSGGTPLSPPRPASSGGTPLSPPSSPASGGTPLTPPSTAPGGGTPLTARPTQPAAAPPAAAATAQAGPSLSAALGSKKKPASKTPVKRVDGRVLLTAANPTVTLDRRQSAIGSLTFEIAGTGSVAAVWELQDQTVGLVDAAVGTVTSPEYGRRPIVELTHHRIVIGLRHVHELRRVLILVSGFRGNDPQRLLMTLHDDSTVESTHVSTSGPVVVALALYQVDGELVIRREDFGFDSGETAGREYGMHLTWLPPISRQG